MSEKTLMSYLKWDMGNTKYSEFKTWLMGNADKSKIIYI